MVAHLDEQRDLMAKRTPTGLVGIRHEGLRMAPRRRRRTQSWLIAFTLFLSQLAMAQSKEVRTVGEIGKALAACMQPLTVADPYPGMRVTVRLGFNRQGQPLGPPRFSYVTPGAPDRTKAEYKTAILEALKRCTPLPFSPGLGATIAGVPLVLRFDERGLVQAMLGESSAYVAPNPLPSSETAPANPLAPIIQPPTYQEPPIWVPGLAEPVPNLQHGPETSQDRRERCMFQSGQYGVPLTNFTQYMGLCTQ